MKAPLVQSLGDLERYLAPLRDILAGTLETIKTFDRTTAIGLGAVFVVMIITAKLLRKLIRRGGSRGGDAAAIYKDAKRARKNKDFVRAGELFEMAGYVEEAIKMYKEGRAFGPLGRLYERQKNWSLAAPAYESAKESEKAGAMYQKAGNYLKAAEALLAGNKVLMAAELFEKAKHYPEAARQFETAGYLQKAAHCHERAQNYPQAAELMEKHYLQERVRISASVSSPEQQHLVQNLALQSGRLYAKAGDHPKAAKIFQMGGFLGDAAETYLAVQDLEKAANLYYEGKHYQKAAQLYEQIGNEKKAYTTRAEIYLDEQNHLEAARMLEKAEEFLQAGDLYERAEQFKKAGEMLMKGGDFIRAGEMFTAAEEPVLAAQSLESGKRYKEAAELYLQAGAFEKAAHLLEESGDFYEAGMIFHQLGRPEDTIAFLQKVDTQSQDYYSASMLLGELFMKRGMLDAARERYKKLISKREIGPDTIEPYYNLGLIYEMNREYTNALLLYDKVVAENYNYKEVQDHIELVKEGIRREHSQAGSGKSPDSGAPKGRYKLLGKVGQGGMGVVYRAEDTVLNRIVAYKVLPPSVKDNPKILENFLQEARVAAGINHPNIVTIFDTGSEGIEPYIIMEFVDGTTLKEILEKTSPMPVGELIAVARQTCQGLEYAHTKNVIHRDIKPANIMVNKEHLVKIMDFGLARLLTSTTIEGTGVQGTPLYMSPEQIEGKRVDHRTDLYSLGCTLFRMATGRPPFIDGDIYHHHLHTPPPPARGLNSNLPEPLDRLILKCMAKNPDERYQRAKEILADLESLPA